MMHLIVSLLVAAANPPCPDGSVRKERTTPEAREEWCEAADGVRHGARRAWHANGQPWFEGDYRRGKREGEWRFWFPNGALMATAAYHDDKADGPMTRYRDDKSKEMEGVCRAGVEDGVWTRFWPNGKQDLVATFKDGKPLSTVQYFSRRGGAIDLNRWLAEKKPGVQPGTPQFAKAQAEHKVELLFGECRN